MYFRCHYFHSNEDKFLKNNSQEILKQLTVGAEPLLSQLVQDTQLIKEFGIIAENLTKSNYDSCVFSSLCCLILKKLICCNYSIRSLWFNENDNILKWIFLSVSSGIKLLLFLYFKFTFKVLGLVFTDCIFINFFVFKG